MAQEYKKKIPIFDVVGIGSTPCNSLLAKIGKASTCHTCTKTKD
jgi:hypothetical protein